MHAFVLQHVPFEGPAAIEPWLKAAGYQVKPVHLYIGDPLPKPEAVSFLVVMGGPMGANDEDAYPWMRLEKRFIQDVIDLGRPVLGICLGAQIIASALGCRVYRNKVEEIGWFPVEGIQHGEPDHFTFPPSFEAFHWHGDTFDLPEGAVHLARTRHCKNQAFQYGSRVIGLQFHLEANHLSAEAMVKNCGDALQPGRTVQTTEAILDAPTEHYTGANQLLDRVLCFLLHAC